jgi:hypothetical protein
MPGIEARTRLTCPVCLIFREYSGLREFRVHPRAPDPHGTRIHPVNGNGEAAALGGMGGTQGCRIHVRLREGRWIWVPTGALDR